MRQVIRFGYDGTAFYGWARQTQLRTVEGEIRRGLLRLGICERAEAPKVEVASRTDRGVSARANALVLESRFPPHVVLRALNGAAPEIYFTAATRVGPEFRVRSALRRQYRYFEPPGPHDITRWRRASELLMGDIDVRSFGRGVPVDRPAVRTVDSIEIRSHEGGLVIDVVGRSFVWNQVRKMVAALRAVEAGDLSEPRLRAATRGEERISLPLAEPERLVLWEVALPVTWEVLWRGPNRRQREYFEGSRAGAWARVQVLSEMMMEEGPPVSPPAPSAPASGRH